MSPGPRRWTLRMGLITTRSRVQVSLSPPAGVLERVAKALSKTPDSGESGVLSSFAGDRGAHHADAFFQGLTRRSACALIGFGSTSWALHAAPYAISTQWDNLVPRSRSEATRRDSLLRRAIPNRDVALARGCRHDSSTRRVDMDRASRSAPLVRPCDDAIRSRPSGQEHGHVPLR